MPVSRYSGSEVWVLGVEGGGAAASCCSLQATLHRVSGGGVNWRLEWSRVVGGGSWEGMLLHLQVRLPRRGEDGRGVGGRTGEGGRVGERIDPTVVAVVGRTGPMGGNDETWTPAPRRNAQNVA